MKQATISGNFQFSTFSKYSPLNPFVLYAPYLDPIFYPNFNQVLPSVYCIINFFSPCCCNCFSHQNQVGHCLSPFFHMGVLLCALSIFKIFPLHTLSSGMQPPLKGTKPLANHSILYLILYSSTISLNPFLDITQVQNFCSQLISNSDFIPCLCFNELLL